MKWLKFISFLSIILAILTFSSSYLEKLLKYCRTENHKFDFYSIYYLESIQPPTKDFFYRNYYINLRNNSFYRNRPRISSPILDTIYKVYPDVKDTQIPKNYKSLYELLDYLTAIKSSNEEFEIIKFYSKTKFKGTEQEINEFIRYLEQNYLEPAISKIRKGQFSEAKNEVEQCLNRLELIDTEPLDNNKVYINRRINRIFLTKALLTNINECYSNNDQLMLLIPKIGTSKEVVNELYIDYPIEDNKDALSFKDYKNYWKGIYAFRKNDYQTAMEFFNLSSKVYDLRDLSNLMIARCIFWSNHENRNNPEILNSLSKIKNEIISNNFRSDIDYYIKYLNPTKQLQVIVKDTTIIDKKEIRRRPSNRIIKTKPIDY